MKYSIRGRLSTPDGSEITADVNKLKYLKFEYDVQSHPVSRLTRTAPVYFFELWLEKLNEKDVIFSKLKAYVDKYGGEISWHECSHNEPSDQPCVIVERYVR